jgi:hypothetical protein
MKSALCVCSCRSCDFGPSLCHEVASTPSGELLSIADAVPFPLLIRGRAFQVLGSNPRFDEDNGESAYE